LNLEARNIPIYRRTNANIDADAYADTSLFPDQIGDGSGMPERPAA
jgi:hypothetical protein